MVNAHRKAMETLWTDRCTVYVHAERTDPETHLTGFKEAALLEGVPCKLSFETLKPAAGSPAAAVTQSVKLFLSPDVLVPAGSKVVVTRQNRLTRSFTFASSGEPGIFHDHQEVSLELWKGWA